MIANRITQVDATATTDTDVQADAQSRSRVRRLALIIPDASGFSLIPVRAEPAPVHPGLSTAKRHGSSCSPGRAHLSGAPDREPGSA
jgi:hypothetical protein